MIRKLLFISLLLAYLVPKAQKLDANEVKLYTEECQDLVAYLQFSLNAIGNNELSPKEKDIIISESYLKLFRDDKVQIEDDLVADREAITNKDVQAYLKDVDFFFSHVQFSYNILSTNLQQDENNREYFKIHALRSLNGKSIQGDSIYNEQARYIEVAVDPNLRELKIVSIYTTKLNEKEENIKWWNDLPLNWKEILGSAYSLNDSVRFSDLISIEKDQLVFAVHQDSLQTEDFLFPESDSLFTLPEQPPFDTLLLAEDSLKKHYDLIIENNLYQIINRKELDLSGRLDINHIDPLSKLTELVSLNLSGTLVSDLYPVRNLVHLRDLNISGTMISQLQALIYSMSLRNLDLSASKVYSLEPLSNLSQIHSLNISLTSIDDLSPIQNFNQLSDLKMQNTMISDLQPISQLVSLDYLYLDNSPVSDLSSLKSLQELRILSANNTMISKLDDISHLDNLNVLYCDNTEITSLEPLDSKKSISRIYCDNTLLGKTKALDFMNKNPNVLVVYESQKLQKWFENLNNTWKKIFVEYIPDIDVEEPSKEQLHLLAGIPEMDLSNNEDIISIEPLDQIQNLQKLNISNTKVSKLDALYELRELKYLDVSFSLVDNLSPLENNNSLKYLDISHTKVTGLNALKELYSLRKLMLDHTRIKSLEPIMDLQGISLLQADETEISIQQFQEFKIKHPDCQVIYQSDELLAWWKTLNSIWKQEFSKIQNWTQEPDHLQLHELNASRFLDISNNRDIKSLDAIQTFVLLEDLNISGSQITNLQPLANLKRLKKLDLSQTPVLDFQVVGSLKNLEWLNISNTQADNLDWMLTLNQLQHLDISGTQVKKLKPITGLIYLKSFIAFNTRINSLKELDALKGLQSVKIYNTKLSPKKVAQFKQTHPHCEVDYF